MSIFLSETKSAITGLDLFAQVDSQSQCSNSIRGFEKTLEDPKQRNQGYRRWTQLRSGLYLLVEDYNLQDPLIVETQNSKPSVELGFRLLGHQEEEAIGPGQNFLCPDSGEGGLNQWLGEQRVLKVDIHVETHFLQSLFWNQLEGISPALQKLLEEDSQLPDGCFGIITAPMQLALQQILNCPYQGTVKLLYLESKVLELIALRLEQAVDPRPISQPPVLQQDEIDRIHQAKEVLLQQISDPPSLIGLARQVGLNDFALKRGFRQVFGTTVFGYLHDRRMEYAWQLLQNGNMTIANVASAVGYINRGHFAAAFRKKFGINPGAYQRSQKQ